MIESRWTLFPGRFQPLHEGHCTIIRNLLSEGRRVLVLMMDREGLDPERNPYTTSDRMRMFRAAFPEEMISGSLKIQSIPAFDSVVYGREVGYQIRRMRLSPEIEAINATGIRAEA